MEENIISEYKFPLIGVVKYAKNHLRRSDSIWYDVACCLWDNGQGYGPYHSYSDSSDLTPQQECYNERKTICLLIITKIQKLMANKLFRMEEVIENASPENSWKVGYYTKQSHIFNQGTLPEWEYWEAVLRAHLSILAYSTYYELGYENWDEFTAYEVPELTKDVKL